MRTLVVMHLHTIGIDKLEVRSADEDPLDVPVRQDRCSYSRPEGYVVCTLTHSSPSFAFDRAMWLSIHAKGGLNGFIRRCRVRSRLSQPKPKALDGPCPSMTLQTSNVGSSSPKRHHPREYVRHRPSLRSDVFRF